jgi:two-component system, NtrC family, response regulator GlrR
MGQMRVLLLNLSPAGKVCAILRNVLQSAPEVKFSYVQESLDFLSSTGNQVVRGIIQGLSPDILILTTCHDDLNRFGPVYDLLTPEAKIPAVAFVETDDLSNVTAVVLQTGAVLMIPEHLSSVDLISLIQSLAGRLEPEALFQPETEGLRPKQLIGESVAFLHEIRKIPVIAKYNSCVLISGEAGTGKEICAEIIHLLSPRAGNPFMPVNCGAIPFELAENELFGHMRGAFTSAAPFKTGLIREAEGGTLFLDEIDNLPQLAQVKLQRFLQERTYRPIGSSREVTADVRIVAATNIDPEEAIRSGRLRQDLYYRLNVLSLRLPPLRERKEDIPLLARHFLRKKASETLKVVEAISASAVQKLLVYDWPGNVSELERVIERAVVLCSERIIDENDIYLEQRKVMDQGASFKEIKEKYIERFEKSYIEKLLLIHNGNISRAAQAAQKHRRAFWQLMRKYGIDAEKYKTHKRK